MQKITPAHKTYRQVEDVREEPIKIGKYIYLGILTVFLLTIFHVLFGHYYLLRGDGFVFSDNQAVELEYDATITDLSLKEGDMIQADDVLFTYDSLSFRKELTQLAFEIAELKNEWGEMKLELLEMNNQIKFAEKYANWSEGLKTDLSKLSKKNLIPRTQLSTESFRSFEAKERLESYKTKRKQVQVNLMTLESNIGKMEINYSQMLERYNRGILRAGVSGIVNDLSVTQGDVLRKGDQAMKIFYGDRYIYAYFDQRSWVGFHPGDTVLVKIAGRGFVRGKIKELMPVTNKIPEEFQPRFKRARRDQLAVIEVESDTIKTAAIMSTVKIVKTFFM